MTASIDNTIKDLPSDHEVESRARAIFRNACENTDSYHALRLGLTRRKALNAGAANFVARIWAPFAGTAVAGCALLVGVVLLRPVSQGAVVPTGVASTVPVATEQTTVIDELPEVASNQMDMVQDLDFYRWLATQPTVATTAPRNRR